MTIILRKMDPEFLILGLRTLNSFQLTTSGALVLISGRNGFKCELDHWLRWTAIHPMIIV